MPDNSVVTPALNLLRRLGLQIPTTPTGAATVSQEQQDKTAKEQQQEMPSWKQFMQGVLDSVGGSSVLNDQIDLHNPYGYGKTLTELMQIAGIPFPIGKKVFHGSPGMSRIAEEGFDMTKNDPGDTLGWMIHAADSPHYAGTYVGDFDTSHNPLAYRSDANKGKGILPLTSNAQNMLDAYNPSTEDLVRLVSGVGQNVDKYGKSKRDIIIDAFKKGDTDISRGHPIRDVVNYMTPQEFSRTGFDAIKYPDIDQTSYAFPDPHQLKYAYSGETVGGKGLINTGPTKDIELPGGGVYKQKTNLDKTGSGANFTQAKSKLQNMPNDDEAYNYIHNLSNDGYITIGQHDDLIDYHYNLFHGNDPDALTPENYGKFTDPQGNEYNPPNWIDTTPSKFYEKHKNAIKVAGEHSK
jgi:hypothetical protein